MMSKLRGYHPNLLARWSAQLLFLRLEQVRVAVKPVMAVDDARIPQLWRPCFRIHTSTVERP